MLKGFELSEMGKALLRKGLRKRFPHASELELHQIFLERLEKCHNRNYRTQASSNCSRRWILQSGV
jgi:hypothetical protein